MCRGTDINGQDKAPSRTDYGAACSLSLIHISSLEVEDIGEAIVKSDLTDMSDIMIELLKRMKE